MLIFFSFWWTMFFWPQISHFEWFTVYNQMVYQGELIFFIGINASFPNSLPIHILALMTFDSSFFHDYSSLIGFWCAQNFYGSKTSTEIDQSFVTSLKSPATPLKLPASPLNTHETDFNIEKLKLSIITTFISALYFSLCDPQRFALYRHFKRNIFLKNTE